MKNNVALLTTDHIAIAIHSYILVSPFFSPIFVDHKSDVAM